MRRGTMNDPGVTRVAVCIDFDNIVISRYDQLHDRGQFQRDKVRGVQQWRGPPSRCRSRGQRLSGPLRSTFTCTG